MNRLYRFFEKITQAFPTIGEELPPNSLLSFILFYTKGYGKSVICLGLLSTAVAILEVSLFEFMGKLVDWLGEYDKTVFWQDKWPVIVGLGVLLLVVLPLVSKLNLLVNFQTLMGNYPMSIRWRIHHHLLKQSILFYQDEFAGRLSTKVMQTALAVRDSVLKLVDVVVYIVVYFVAMLLILFDINGYLAIPLIVWVLLYITSIKYFLPKLRKISQEQADARSTMTGRIVDAYTNIATIKLFAHTKEELSYSKESMQQFLDTVYQQMRLVSTMIFSVNVLNYALAFFVIIISIYLWQSELITVGDIAIAVALSLRVNSISHWLMFEIGSLFENIGMVSDGMKTLSEPILVQDKPGAKKLTVSRGEIIFNRVNFKYNYYDDVLESKQQTEEKSIEKNLSVTIDNLSLTVKAGERVGIVGKSGAGKSTLINLLLRFYDIQSGCITIDDQNITDVTQDSLRKNVAVVTQDTSLLHRTVRENITYGNPDVSDEYLQKVISQAKLDSFIGDLLDKEGNRGLDAQVGERGVKLSGGQRQRIALARALLKNSPILVLDEATSALDSQTEQAIQENLSKLMENKTVIAIAHRLSTIANMDRLIVIDKGNVIEQGSHQDLIKLDGVYANLWRHQTNGFIGEN